LHALLLPIFPRPNHTANTELFKLFCINPLEQQRWGIENRTHHTLDVTHREDESRVAEPNAASVLGIFRRLSNAFKQVWAKGRPKREATSRDWTEENQFNRWRGIRLITDPIPP
jgi:hypothetical protein